MRNALYHFHVILRSTSLVNAKHMDPVIRLYRGHYVLPNPISIRALALLCLLRRITHGGLAGADDISNSSAFRGFGQISASAKVADQIQAAKATGFFLGATHLASCLLKIVDGRNSLGWAHHFREQGPQSRPPPEHLPTPLQGRPN